MSGPAEVVVLIDGERIPIELDATTAAAIRRAAAARRRARQATLERAVRGYLREHSESSANAVFRAIGGRRSDVLSAFKRVKVASQSTQGVKGAARSVPEPGYRQSSHGRSG